MNNISNRVGGFGMDMDGLEESPDTERAPAPTKQDFKALIARIDAACAGIDTVYPQLIEVAMPFDRELARKIESAQQADRELLTYVKSKVEAQQVLPSFVVAGLLGSR